MPIFSEIKGWAKLCVSPAFFIFVGSLALVSCDWLDVVRPAAGPLSRSEQPAVKPGTDAAAPSGGEIMTPRDRFAFHRWVVTEMQEQIFARPLKDKNSTNGWANVLSQKGSIEGVYHGFVLSTDYLELEKKSKAADIKALRFFGNEMALMDHPMSRENDPEVQAGAANYVKGSLAEHFSLFTLKRELGERILKESLARKADTEKLAAWYASIVARWAKLEVPFGLPQRNDRDEVFHFEWAKKNSLGMLQWELLNREHRILNQLGGVTASQGTANPPGK